MTQDERRIWLRAIIKSLNDERGDGGVSKLARLTRIHPSNIRRRLAGTACTTDRDMALIAHEVNLFHAEQAAKHKNAQKLARKP
ncbi:hypothetical protein [Zavarzinella formosa]|uniref:hypothetical protein n=1 Tax=Zavarzinella formosa TaxID=360055 RepID=UPI00030CACB0|nr:hypothetical protein [Zavarzinella formosa]